MLLIMILLLILWEIIAAAKIMSTIKSMGRNKTGVDAPKAAHRAAATEAAPPA